MKLSLVQLVFLGTALASPLNGIMRRPSVPASATNAGLPVPSASARPPERHPEHHGPFGPSPNGTAGPVSHSPIIFEPKTSPGRGLQS